MPKEEGKKPVAGGAAPKEEKKKEEKKKKRRGKRPKTKTRRVKKHTLYEAKGEKAERKRTPCPKCGAGVFMAEHKDRITCGHCGYTKWKK